jgi:diacylglycerol O-acyltransferase
MKAITTFVVNQPLGAEPAGRLMQRWMIRVMNRQRLVNLLASNLHGPEHRMSFAGATILEVFQIGVAQGNLAVSVGALSYAGQLNVDIVADTDVVPDLAVFANALTNDLERLGARSPTPSVEPSTDLGA